STSLMASYTLPSTYGRARFPTRSAVNTLPDRSQGYDQVGLVVASAEFPFEELAPEQKSALVEWVKLGGTCLVFPAADPARTRIEPLRLLLDGVNVRQVDSTLPALKKKLAIKTWPFDTPGNRVYSMDEGEAAFSDRDSNGAGFALCSVRPFGMGAVAFLGIECENATHAWMTGGNEFWNVILDPVRESVWSHAGRNAQRRAWEFSAGSETHSKVQNGLSSMPSVVFIAIFMIAYVVVVCPVNFLVMRRFKRNPWVVISVPLVSLAFVGVLFAYAYLERGSADKLRRVVIIETASGSDFGLEYECGVFMAGNGRLCRLEYGDGGPVFSFAEREQMVSRGVVEQSGAFALADVAIKNWEMVGFGLRGCRDLGGTVVVQATASVKIVNELPVGIARGMLVSLSSMTFIDVPAVAPGASSSVDAYAFDKASNFTGANTARLFGQRPDGGGLDARERAQHFFEHCQDIIAGSGRTGFVFIGVLERPYQQLAITPGLRPEIEETCFIVVRPK
ncbi:MAG: hypothetical protein RDV41_15845, partial [Planctomycetota bacterium]|nr:hypothetical protein [Planctomycetota bacterium]